MMADIKQENNWVNDNGKVEVTHNDVRHRNVVQRSTIDMVAQVLICFCGETTMYGLGQMSYHTARIAKFAWIVVFLGAQTGLWYYISNRIQLYIDRKSRGDIENSSGTQYYVRINQTYEEKTINCQSFALTSHNY